jgi:hypothetical protein
VIEIERDADRVSGKLTGACTTDEVQRAVAAGVSHMFVNSDSLDDLSFLPRLPLRELDLVAMKPGTAITPVNFLHDLVRLNLAVRYAGELKANGLVNLAHCFLDWGKGAESIVECANLRYLYVSRYNGADVAMFAGLPQLRAFRVTNSRKLSSIQNLAEVASLRALGLYRCPALTSIAGAPSAQLVKLDADTCSAVTDWGSAASAALKYVGLQSVGDLPSITPFRACEAIEFFWFPESTDVLDGQVRWLGDVDTLRNTGFQNRRHYDAKSADIKAMIEARHGAEPWSPPGWDSI